MTSVKPREKQFVVVRHITDISMCRMYKLIKEVLDTWELFEKRFSMLVSFDDRSTTNIKYVRK